jgi:futalosine hydrolase
MTYTYGGASVTVCITGVGLPLTAFALGRHLATHRYDLLVQAGVAGAIDRQLALAQVVEVVSECFADVGVEEADGTFTSATAMGLIAADAPPFAQGRLWKGDTSAVFLPQVHGISVNTVHGQTESVLRTMAQYPFAQVESMEGAAFFYAALLSGCRFVQVRSISNYVERRQRENWRLHEAIASLNVVLQEMLRMG